MLKRLAPALGLLVLAALPAATQAQQNAPVTGDHSTPLRPLSGEGNVAISNSVLRNQPDVRVLRVVLEPGGTRALHDHSDVKFHLFMPISGPMTLQLDDGPVIVQPWHPYYMQGGTRHGFRNDGTEAVEIVEVFVP